MPQRESVSTDAAPAAIGPYSQGMRTGDLLFCSGQIPLDPTTGELVGDTTADQARQCLTNLKAVCTAAGAQLTDAVRITVWLVDMNDFAAVNEVYEGFFDDEPPARVAIAVAALPKGAAVEIDAIVAQPD